MISLTVVRSSYFVPMAQWVEEQGSEALDTGSNRSLYIIFSTLVIRREIVMPPS